MLVSTFVVFLFFFFFKQKTAYEIVSRDWSSDVCSSDLGTIFTCKNLGKYNPQLAWDRLSVCPRVIHGALLDRKSVV